MNLFSETAGFLGWLSRLGAVFFRARPITSTVAVFVSALNRLTSILAFLLPLKVILLVASDGVSRWFQPLVGPGGKDTLVWTLTIAAIASFFLSIVLDALSDRLAASASHTVLKGSNELSVVGNQGAEARTIFAQFVSIVSGMLFTGAGLAVIGLVNPLLAGVLGFLFLAEYLFTAAAMAGGTRTNPGPLKRFVTEDLRDYLNLLSSLTFLVAFGVLLYPFVWGGGGDVLAALVSVIVLRRILGVIVDFVRGGVQLTQRRVVINALVFREHQYRDQEADLTRTLRQIFSKNGRQARARELFASAGLGDVAVDAFWQDSSLGGMNVLALTSSSKDEHVQHWQQQIYLPKQDYRLENEAVLFDYVSRGQMLAPEVLLRFKERPFECQICDAGSGEAVDASEWGELRMDLLARLMSVRPPPALTRAYTISRPLLQDRLSDDLIQRCEVGVDDDAERKTLEALVQHMSVVRELLYSLPLYIQNPEIRPANVLVDKSGQPMVMTWGKWSLEPVGVGVPDGVGTAGLDSLTDTLRAERPDLPDGFWNAHLRLGRAVRQLEQRIEVNMFKAALESAQEILENELVAEAVARESLGTHAAAST